MFLNFWILLIIISLTHSLTHAFHFEYESNFSQPADYVTFSGRGAITYAITNTDVKTVSIHTTYYSSSGTSSDTSSGSSIGTNSGTSIGTSSSTSDSSIYSSSGGSNSTTRRYSQSYLARLAAVQGREKGFGRTTKLLSHPYYPDSGKHMYIMPCHSSCHVIHHVMSYIMSYHTSCHI
jgi:hypothetical protein